MKKVDDIYSYCDQLEKAIDFLEDAPEQMEKLEDEVEKLRSYKDVVETIARVAKDMGIIGVDGNVRR